MRRHLSIRRGRSARLTAAVAVSTLTASGGIVAVAEAKSHAKKPKAPAIPTGTKVVSLAGGTVLEAATTQSNGDVVATGAIRYGKRTQLIVVRYLPTGKLDPTFGRGGTATGPSVSGVKGTIGRAIAISNSGVITVVGDATGADAGARDGLLVERFAKSGAVTRSFGHGGSVVALAGAYGEGNGIALEANGGIVAAGSAYGSDASSAYVPQVAVVRLNPNGSLDQGYADGGAEVLDLGPYSTALGAALSPGGKVVIVGSTSPDTQSTYALIARLTSSGTLDRAFGGGEGYVATQYASGAALSQLDTVAVSSSGTIVAGGSALIGKASGNGIVVKLTGSGVPSYGWGSGGVASVPAASHFTLIGTTVPGLTGLAFGAGGSVVAAGWTQLAGTKRAAVWQFTSHGRLARAHGTTLLGQSGAQANAIALGPKNRATIVGTVTGQTGGLSGMLASFSL